MPKISVSESALHDWVHTLTFQQQALLMTGMRGPDGCNKHNPAKVIVRFLRGAICKPAGNWDGENNNDFMWGDYSVFSENTRKFFDDPDGYPHHFIMHLVHCAEVIGYRHPLYSVGLHWHEFYIKACHSLHMTPETVDQMDNRLNDFGVGPASHPAPALIVEAKDERIAFPPGSAVVKSLDQLVAEKEAIPQDIHDFAENAPDHNLFDEWPQNTAYETGWYDAALGMYRKMQGQLDMLHGKPFSLRVHVAMEAKIKSLESNLSAANARIKELQDWVNSHI